MLPRIDNLSINPNDIELPQPLADYIASATFSALQSLRTRVEEMRTEYLELAAELGLELAHNSGPGRRKKRRNGHAHHAAD